MKKLLFFVICIILLAFIWKQYRHFYQVDDVTFTAWKTSEGYCYITPYKYWGVSPPKNNYIKLSNVGYINIFIDKDSTLLIFNDYFYLKNNNVECKFNDYKYKHFGLDSLSSMKETKLHEIKRKEHKRYLPYIEMDVGYMKVETQNSSHISHSIVR